MNVSVVVPYRSDGGHRDMLWNWVAQRWFRHFPDIEIVVSDDLCNGQSLNHGQARNLAAAAAQGDILVFADADTTFAPEPLKAAVQRAYRTYDWCVAEHYIHLTKQYTRTLIDQDPLDDLPADPPCEDRVRCKTSGGHLVIRKDIFDEHGGYDERWPGWGPDDLAFAATLETLYRPGIYYPDGTVYHLWHPRGAYCWDTNWELRDRYVAAIGNREALKELHDGIYVR